MSLHEFLLWIVAAVLVLPVMNEFAEYHDTFAYYVATILWMGMVFARIMMPLFYSFVHYVPMFGDPKRYDLSYAKKYMIIRFR